jgi:hypothetical protein
LAYSITSGTSVCSGSTTSVVNAPRTYGAGGPLEVLNLGNNVVETHSFDQRYYPTAITAMSGLTSLLPSWTYITDAVGNITAIGTTRTYAYQDDQYFLTQGNAPTLWGARSWTYDAIGNRLTETRGSGQPDQYHYTPNASGDTPLLTSIALAGGAAGTKSFTIDPAGNVIQEDSPNLPSGHDG